MRTCDSAGHALPQLLVDFPLITANELSEKLCPTPRKRVLAKNLADAPYGYARRFCHGSGSTRDGGKHGARATNLIKRFERYASDRGHITV
jgi:hypothetical protein